MKKKQATARRAIQLMRRKAMQGLTVAEAQELKQIALSLHARSGGAVSFTVDGEQVKS